MRKTAWLAAVSLWVGGASAFAGTIEWEGVASTVWSNNASWVGGTAPANNVYQDTAKFTTASSSDPVLTAARSVHSVIFERSVTVNSDATVRTLTLTTGVTRITISPSCVVTMNVSVASAGGATNKLAAGSRLVFRQNAPPGGTYSLADGASVAFVGANITQFNLNPAFYGTGEMLFNGTLGSNLRVILYNQVRMTVGSNAAVTGPGSNNFLIPLGTNTIAFQRDFDMRPLVEGALNVGVDAANKNRTAQATLQMGGNTFSVNSVKFWGTENSTAKNPQLILDGGTLQVGGVANSQLQGLLLTSHAGALYSGYASTVTDLTVTLGSTANGGVIRLDSAGTFSHCSTNTLGAPSCYGAKLLLTNTITLINNAAWTNNNSKSAAAYTGLVVTADATLGGTGAFEMGATALGANAKYAVVSGHVSPAVTNRIGTLTVTCNSLTWDGVSASASSWTWDIGAGNAADKLLINGDFNKGSGSAFVFDLQNLWVAGTYEVVEWTGSTTFSASDFAVANGRGSFSISGKKLILTVPLQGTLIRVF